MTAPRFLKIFFTTMGLGLMAVATLNWAVDPYASFRWNDIKGFNDQKKLKRGGGRVNKSVILGSFAFDTVFLGTSATETGLNPDSPVLNGTKTFNAGLPFADMTQIHGVASYVAAHQNPRRVIIGLDFVLFSDHWGAKADYADSAFSGRSLLPIYAQRLLSGQALADSASVVAASVRGKRSPFGKQGGYDPAAAKVPDDFRKQFAASLDSYLAAHAYGGYHYAPRHLALLGDAITRLRANGTEVLLFITPVHAVHLDMVEAVGLAPQYEAWTHELTTLVAALNQQPGAPVRLWDFAGFNSVTTEAVPEQPGGRMHGYWDALHYSATTGDLVLCRMLGCTAPVPDDFGVELTTQTQPPHRVSGALAAFSGALADKAKALRVNR
ncbi:MAG: hypothetical protein H7Z12_11300 [Rhodospirillaceae bacterium]|nr:hypothetical protein [Rhodospirillales bacterium]